MANLVCLLPVPLVVVVAAAVLLLLLLIDRQLEQGATETWFGSPDVVV